MKKDKNSKKLGELINRIIYSVFLGYMSSFFYLWMQGIFPGVHLFIMILIFLLLVIYWYLHEELLGSSISFRKEFDFYDEIYKQAFGMLLCKIYININPLLYFYNKNSEFHVKFQRYLNEKVRNDFIRKLIYDSLMFLFYYPVTRFFFIFFKVVKKFHLIIKKLNVIGELKVCISTLIFTMFYLCFFFFFKNYIVYFCCYFLFILIFLCSLFRLIVNVCSYLFIIFFNYNGLDWINSFILINGYPSLAEINFSRYQANFFSKIYSVYFMELKSNNEVYKLLNLYFYIGNLNERNMVWSILYFKRESYINMNLENSHYVAFEWYAILWFHVSTLSYSLFKLKFFYQFFKDKGVIDQHILNEWEELIQFGEYFYTRALDFLLSIEFDWNVSSVERIERSLIYQLKVNKIIKNDYVNLLNNIDENKHFNVYLEEEIINFYMDNYKKYLAFVENTTKFFSKRGETIFPYFKSNTEFSQEYAVQFQKFLTNNTVESIELKLHINKLIMEFIEIKNSNSLFPIKIYIEI